MAAEDRGVVANQPARFADFLEGLVPAEEPTLHFVHLILPHGPWRFFPDGTEYESPDGDPEGEIACQPAGSSGSVKPNSHRASAGERFTQPCDRSIPKPACQNAPCRATLP